MLLPTKKGTGFPSAITRTILPQHEGKSHEQLESKLHSGAPKRHEELAQKRLISLKNGASHPELGQNALLPLHIPSLETRELIIDVSGTAVNRSLTPPITVTYSAEGLVIVG